MSANLLWTYLVELKLPFENRLLIFGALIAALVLANLFHFIVKKRETWLGVTSYLKRVEASRFRLPEIKFLRWLDGAWRKLLIAEFMFLRHGNFAPYNLSIGTTLLVLTLATLFSRPYILSSSPQNGSFMLNADQTIDLEFSLPVDIAELSLNVSPETEGNWDFARTIFNIPITWRAKFYPAQSFYPESKIVIYVVGLKSLWNPATVHEQAVEFFAPKLPQVISINPSSGSQLVPVNTQVEVEYDSVIGDFVKLDFQISPKRELTVLQNGGTRQVLGFDQELEQGKSYTLVINRTPRTYETSTGKVLDVGETERIQEVKFKTVDAPLLASYSPTGEAVHPDSPIKVTFKEPMDTQSVEESFAVSPTVSGAISWEVDNRTFIFTPLDYLPKETAYQVTFKKGLKNIYGGVTAEDLKFSFTTIGKVKVTSIYPGSGTTNLDPTKTNVVVEFDQEVNHSSAQSKLSLTPAVSGSFLWDGNKLIYTTAGKLAYNQSYTVKVASGVKTVNGLDSTQAFTATFTTRSQTVELAVPQFYQNPQTQTFNCNLVATKMALAYRGISVSQEQVKAALGVGQNPNADFVDGYGVHYPPISQYLTSLGVKHTVKVGWNLTGLAQEVERGNPVILWWYNRYSQPKGAFTLSGGYTGYKGMHSEVVRGFTGSSSYPIKLLVNDPWRGQLVYDRALFLATWAYFNYTAIVVYP